MLYLLASMLGINALIDACTANADTPKTVVSHSTSTENLEKNAPQRTWKESPTCSSPEPWSTTERELTESEWIDCSFVHLNII
jgi:hypothetical protein